LNSSTLRRDEWNPAPPALLIEERELGDSSSDRLARIIEFGDGYESEERDKEAFVVMDGLSSLEDNPLETEYDVIDFTRQMLQVSYHPGFFSPMIYFYFITESRVSSRKQHRTGLIHIS